MLDAHRQLDHLLEVQRELSKTRPVADTLAAFLRIIRKISPAEWLVYLTCVPEDDGACRVLYDGAVEEGFLDTMGTLFTNQSDGFRKVQGGLLCELVSRQEPSICNDVGIDPDDPGVGHLADTMRSVIAVPIYWEGAISSWSISFAPDPGAFGEAHLRLAVSHANMLARSMLQMEMLTRVEELNKQLERQLRELAAVQRSLLPRSVPSIPGWRVTTSYRTSLHAGGDYYDFTEFPDGHHGIVIADVSGHGAAAAALMAVMRTILHTLGETGVGSQEMIDLVNRVVLDSVGEGMFVSAYFLVLDPSSGTMICVNCGHPAPRILRAGARCAEPLDGDGLPPLGLVDYTNVPACTHTLEPGDTLVLYTDGITEAFDEQRIMFGTEGLDRAIEAGRGGDGILHAIETHVERHAPNPADDQTVVVIEHVGV